MNDASKQAAEAMMLLKSMNFNKIPRSDNSTAPSQTVNIKQEEIEMSEKVAVSGYPMVEYSSAPQQTAEQVADRNAEPQPGPSNAFNALQIHDDLAMSESDDDDDDDNDFYKF